MVEFQVASTKAFHLPLGLTNNPFPYADRMRFGGYLEREDEVMIWIRLDMRNSCDGET
jgi:hypothetical protein